MKALASLAMRGRTPAIALAVVLAALSLIILPLGLLSTAVVVLVALRHGGKESAVVVAGGLLALAGLGGLIFGKPAALVLLALLMWAPAVALGLLLRASMSLSLTLEVALLAAAGLVIGQYLLGDPIAFWSALMMDFLSQMADPAMMGEADRQQVVAAMAPWMVGGVAAAWFLQQALVLFLARYWQAALYNPGGFRAEFHGLRLRRWLFIAMPALLLASLVQGQGASPLAQFVLVIEAGMLIQGVALVHGLIGRFNAQIGWLIGFYSLLVMGMPWSVTAVTLAGFLDGWLDFRAKARSRSEDDGAGE